MKALHFSPIAKKKLTHYNSLDGKNNKIIGERLLNHAG